MRLLGTACPFEHGVAFSQPSREQPKSCSQVNDRCRYPHDQPSDLLIVERGESPRLCCGAVGRIPKSWSKGEQRAEDTGVNGCREHVEHSWPICFATMRVE